MDTRAKIGLGVGGAVIALGAAVGVGALAANLGTPDIPAGQNGYEPDGRGQDGRGGDGAGTRGGMDTAALTKTLAGKLGVDETKMATALKEVMSDSRPSGAPSGQPSGPPTGARNGGSGMTATMAKSLAEKLDLDEATVLAALQEAMAAQR